MGLTKEQSDKVENVLQATLRNKFQNYKPESTSMPFHVRLLGKDRLALYSFIHSLTTNFGTTIFESVAEAIARNSFKNVKVKTTVGNAICEDALFEIQKIMDGLVTATISPNKSEEIEIIRKVCQTGKLREVKPTKVDLLVESQKGDLYLFDLKTAKPNIGNFKEFKRTLLEWVAVVLATNPHAKINTLLAIPYNPEEPKPYARWTIRGMLDLPNELKVADEFWDFLGGQGTYQDLLDCFERVGIEMRDEIDKYFARFNK
jgi:type II restriction enzyme